MKVGGQIPWNVTLICETSQFYYLMGRRLVKGRFGQPFKGPIIPFGSLVEYYPITAKDQSRIHQKEGFTWIVRRIRSLRGGNLEGWRTDRRPWGVGNDGRIGNLTRKDSMQKRWYFPNKEIFSNRRWTNQNTRRRSGTENIHLDAAATNSRRGSRWLSWRIWSVFSTTLWLTSGCRWSDERFLVHVGKNQKTAITLNRESNFTRREKNHSLFHWNTLT